jgi:hypothetical protein
MSWTSWRNIMRTEVQAGRPVLLSGFGSGGHAFNLDGWRDDDYFHLNWGWGGSFNGWFLINQLNPGGQDFSQGEGAVVGLVPTQYQHAPQPVAPAGESEDVACEPVQFQWSEVPGATSYDLEVDMSGEFRSPLASFTGVTEAARSVETLDHYSTYYWRIRSHGSLGTSPWSNTSRFTTAYWSQTPEPMPATPMNGAVQVHLNPTVLVWDFVTDGQSYDLQVDDAADFASPVLDTLNVTTHYVVYRNRLEPGATYWWRVRCMGVAGLSEWSDARSFTTESLDMGKDAVMPRSPELASVWPNPFNPSTTVGMSFPAPTRASLAVYNMLGERVALLADNQLFPAGEQQVTWMAGAQPSGVYLVVLDVDGARQLRKVTLLR